MLTDWVGECHTQPQLVAGVGGAIGSYVVLAHETGQPREGHVVIGK